MALYVEAPVLKELTAPTRDDGRMNPSAAYPSFLGVEIILTLAMKIFKAGPYRLAELLGVPNHESVRQWLKGSNRPSSLYMSRLSMLLMMSIEGIDVTNIRAVDYINGKYYLKVANAQSKDLQPVP